MIKMNGKKLAEQAFTLIELIVVIAVIGVLVLLAAPKFLGYTKDAKLMQIRNDVKSYEAAIEAKRIEDSEFIANWTSVDKANLEGYRNSGHLFDKKGVVKDNYQFDDEYFEIEVNSVSSKLTGDFILAKGGKVFYYDEDFKSENEDEENIHLAQDDDFEWIKNNIGQVGLNGEKGYFKYTGKGKKAIEIPHVIQGVEITSYHYMFGGYPENDVIKVVSTNKNITDMSKMFQSSTATSLNVSQLDTSNVINMSEMFYLAKGLEIAGLNSFDTSNVTNMKGTFAWTKASELDVSKFDTSNVTDMSYMFDSSFVEKIIGLENFDTSNVTQMSRMFHGYQSTELDVSKFDTSNVTDMSYMFRGTQAISLDLSNFVTKNVVDMSQMFYDSRATSLILNNFNTSNVENMEWMFGGSYLKVDLLDLSSFDTSKVINMDNMFSSSKVTAGYAREEEDADRFNSSKHKPYGLIFIVK